MMTITIVGQQGCGKTTLANRIRDMLALDGDHVEVREETPFRRRIGDPEPDVVILTQQGRRTW